jgi:hypothetical protein
MKPLLLGATIGLLTFSIYLIAYSPGVAYALIDPRYTPKYRTTKA